MLSGTLTSFIPHLLACQNGTFLLPGVAIDKYRLQTNKRLVNSFIGMTFQITLKRYTFYSLFCAFILAVHTEGRMSLLLRQPENDDDTRTHTYYTDRRAFRFPMLLCCLFSLFEVFCFVSVSGELILMVLLPVWRPYTGPCGSLFFSTFPICILVIFFPYFVTNVSLFLCLVYLV